MHPPFFPTPACSVSCGELGPITAAAARAAAGAVSGEDEGEGEGGEEASPPPGGGAGLGQPQLCATPAGSLTSSPQRARQQQLASATPNLGSPLKFTSPRRPAQVGARIRASEGCVCGGVMLVVRGAAVVKSMEAAGHLSG